MKPSEIEQLIASGDVEFQRRCSFCNGLEVAEGNLGVMVAPGEFIEVPIGPNCLEQAKKSSAKWVDNPNESVVE